MHYKKDRVALKPPLGWNSWDCYGPAVNEVQLLGNVRYMAEHLKAHGWQYVVCDIQWYEPEAGQRHWEYNRFAELCMDGFGRLIPAENRFPSAANGAGFKPIADQIHALGLKFGIHIMRGVPRLAVHRALPVKGTNVTCRDIAHAKLKERLDNGEELPEYFKNHPVYYAGPAKTPAGMACGSMGPTTAGRMDPYVDLFQSHGGSMVMLAKGNRSQQVTDACHKHGGFYLGSIGGPAAILAQNNIKSIECVEYPELGMEAIWKIHVEDFPAFILVDDKGNDFFKQIKPRCAGCK